MTESNERRHDESLPADPQTRPEDTVDALEEEVLGETTEQGRDEDETDAPAFEQDFDTGDPDSDRSPNEPPG